MLRQLDFGVLTDFETYTYYKINNLNNDDYPHPKNPKYRF